MNKCLYIIKDLKAKRGMEIFSYQNDDIALQELKLIVNDPRPGNKFYEFSSDFQLWKLGQFDYQKLQFIKTEPELLADLVSLKNNSYKQKLQEIKYQIEEELKNYEQHKK